MLYEINMSKEIDILSNYKILLFDADNTLFDFDKAEKHALEKTLTDAIFTDDIFIKYHEINDSLWKKIETGEITRQFLRDERFRLLLSHLGYDEADAGRLGGIFVENLGMCNFLIDGAEQLCRDFRESGKFEMYIVTNGISSVQRSRFYSSPISEYFDGIFISDDIGFSKPSFEFFDYVHKNTGLRPKKEYIIIGDSLSSDIKGGIGFGIDTCWYCPKNTDEVKYSEEVSLRRKITYTITKLDELRRLL